MRTASSVRRRAIAVSCAAVSGAVGACAVGACARAADDVRTPTRQGPAVVTARTVGARTMITIRTAEGARHEVLVTRDSTVAADAAPERTVLVGEVERGVVVTDVYASIPGGLSRCQAGEEQFLRVLGFDGDRTAETYRAKTASCREGIELAEPGIEWTPGSAVLRLHWLAGPSRRGAVEERVVNIGPDGRPR